MQEVTAGYNFVVLAGDFNCSAGPYLEALIRNNLCLSELVQAPLQAGTMTGLSADFGTHICIDHAFRSPGLICQHAYTEQSPTNPWGNDAPNLPIADCPSDHVPVRFVFRPEHTPAANLTPGTVSVTTTGRSSSSQAAPSKRPPPPPPAKSASSAAAASTCTSTPSHAQRPTAAPYGNVQALPRGASAPGPTAAYRAAPTGPPAGLYQQGHIPQQYGHFSAPLDRRSTAEKKGGASSVNYGVAASRRRGIRGVEEVYLHLSHSWVEPWGLRPLAIAIVLQHELSQPRLHAPAPVM